MGGGDRLQLGETVAMEKILLLSLNRNIFEIKNKFYVSFQVTKYRPQGILLGQTDL